MGKHLVQAVPFVNVIQCLTGTVDNNNNNNNTDRNSRKKLNGGLEYSVIFYSRLMINQTIFLNNSFEYPMLEFSGVRCAQKISLKYNALYTVYHNLGVKIIHVLNFIALNFRGLMVPMKIF